MEISACVLRHDISGVTTLLSIWLPPITVLPLYRLPPPVTLLPLYWLPPCNILFFATLWTLLIYHAFYFLALAVGLLLITLAGGGIDCILCLQCNRCLKIVIDYEHYLFIMRSFFLALAVGLSLITWGGGGGWWLVTSYVSFFPFLSPVNSFLHLFATFCSDFATFWTLLIYHAFYFFAHAVGLPLITWGGGGGGSAVYNQCCAVKTKACLFFASRGPAIRWAWTFYFFLIDAGDNS